MELPGEDRGGDPSPRPEMRERERVDHVTRTVSTLTQLVKDRVARPKSS